MNDELYGMTAEQMQEISKSQEAGERRYYEKVCKNCPTKNCRKKENETVLECEKRKMSTAMIAQHKEILYLLYYSICYESSKSEDHWEESSWNKDKI